MLTLIYRYIYIGQIKVAEDSLKQNMDKTTPLAFFLCKSKNEGSGMMAMINFLASSQNQMLIEYIKTPNAIVGDTSLLNATEADIISYSSDADLLPLVYMHCNYSLELGKGNKVEYNFDKILGNLMNKVFCGKSMLEIQIQEFVYLDDVHSARKFTNLGNIVKQVNGFTKNISKSFFYVWIFYVQFLLILLVCSWFLKI